MVKWLKSPNSPNIVEAGLTVAELDTIAERLEPRTAAIELSRTPIEVISKTAKPLLV